MSQFALEALEAKAIKPDAATREPRPCVLADFDTTRLVVGLKEAEHRPLIERRFPSVASRVLYWDVDDIGFAHPSVALAKIDDRVRELVSTLD